MLRKHGVVGKFVEFYGEGMSELSLADRATIANMSPESDDTVSMIESYLRANKLFVDYSEPQCERVYSSYLELDLQDAEPCISGPKRPHDRVPLREMKADWQLVWIVELDLRDLLYPRNLRVRLQSSHSMELQHNLGMGMLL
ncbi:hypothetical protein LWI28_012074 [Acer negundo]|uniref:Aconitase/3-isopropylmalate dehydratase large subunit alpha/beta/alpha domain-containing protein n=1 Tax=Acer negundo TaxID=4023 RepID=A0AAD5IIF3_ACENE|nr:hypothetical protein LWI28_012074 [Acer negundo]